MRNGHFAAAVLATLAFLCGAATAADHFLTIGGGYSPTGNQVSLEKNILLYQKLLAEKYPTGVRHDVLFADGADPARDLVFEDTSNPPAKQFRYMARIFKQEKYFGQQFRNHRAPNVRDASSKATLERWFDEVGSTLTPRDRLFIYVTAHGGSASDKKKAPYNTKLYMWNREHIMMRDFTSLLDKLPAETPVSVVMVQCFSGGFADLIFEGGDRDKGFSKARRCGFFATVHDRVAAGCTPDIDEENYREYSSYFWAAVRGKTRTDQPIESPDYNHDGRVGFDEAHAYSLLTSTTIDISIKTSDAFLRKYSKTEDKNKPDLLKASSPYDTLLAGATICEKQVLESLCQTLKLEGENRDEAAKQRAEEINKEKKAVDEKRKPKQKDYDEICKSLQEAVKEQWPEVANRWNPQVTTALTSEADQLIDIVESHKDYSKWLSLHDELEALKVEKMNLDRDWVRCQRVRRVLENVALAANLPQVADEATVERYQQLLEDESRSLGPASAAATAAANR